jgi:hypothetical protein
VSRWRGQADPVRSSEAPIVRHEVAPRRDPLKAQATGAGQPGDWDHRDQDDDDDDDEFIRRRSRNQLMNIA